MADITFLAAEWPTISRRLDEALSLTVEDRVSWLDALAESESVKSKLRGLLAAADGAPGVETADYLAAPPQLTLGPDAVIDEHPMGIASVGLVIGPYRLIRELGVGGMGSVWLAERADGGLKREVALKLPRISWSQGLAERMRRERDILASLDHPNIARIYEAGLDAKGRPYLALEYVEGDPIDVYCKQRALGINERLRLLLQVARAVAHAHARLVVHRDLKPANILVTKDGQVRLLDFGIAKLMEGDLTQETQLTQLAGRALTLDYASPEQIRGGPIGTASDVYSLGVVAYELLAEAKPYQLKRQSAAALEEAIANVDVRLASVATANPNLRRILTGDLDAILNKALKKNVTERYPTVDAFAQDIERYLAHLPVQAQPDTFSYRLQRFLVRDRMAIAAGTVVIASLIVGAGIATVKTTEARSERVRAERVKDLMGSIFAAANPYVSGKADATVRDLLDSGVERIERELGAEPAASAELLSLLSVSYRDLGEVDRALKTAQSANELAIRAFPEGHLMQARVRRVLAEANSSKGNLAEAHRLLDQAIAMQRRLGEPGAFDLAQSLGFLASVTVGEGREKEAIVIARESISLFTWIRGEKDPMTIAAIGELSNKLMIAGDKSEALVQAQRAYALASAAFTEPEHPVTVGQMAHVAYALHANGQIAEAKQKWLVVVAAQKKAFNPRGPQVSASLVGLARSQEALGELTASLQNFEESLSMLQSFGSGVSGELAIRYFSIGRLALQVRQSEKAVRFFATAIEHGRAVFGERGNRVRDAENFYVTSLIYAGRLQEADSLLAKQLEQDRQSSEPGANLRASLRNHALLSRARGEAKAALGDMEEALDVERRMSGVSRKASAATLGDMGIAKLDVRQIDAAISYLTQSMTILGKEEPAPTPQQADVWVALGRAYLLSGRNAEAAQQLASAEQFWANFDATNIFAGEAALWKARALVHADGIRVSEAKLALAMSKLQSSGWPSHQQLAVLGRTELLARK